MLQTACMSPELLVNQNMSESEICGYSPGQGSPVPGETASPKSCFQQSPSLPDSGLTELNVASPKIYHSPPPCKPPGMPASADSELSSDPPQRRYMGVRVKMPVRELLRKIRLSKGLDPAHGKEASSVKMVTKGSSGKTAEKRRAHPYTEKQLRQSKQSAGQSPKGLEDLDILVEVLQEDLNKSQLREEPLHPVPDGAWQGFSADLQSSRWESVGSKEAAGGLQGRQHSSAELHSGSCVKNFQPILQERQHSSGLHSGSCVKNFQPILQERQHSSGLHSESSPKGFQPILQGAQCSSGLHSGSCVKNFQPILQERQCSSGLHSESSPKGFQPILQGRQHSSGLHSESCVKNFQPILQGTQRSSGLHSESCPKGFQPILQGTQHSSAELHSGSCPKGCSQMEQRFQPILRAEPSSHGEQGRTRGSSSPGMLRRTGERGSWWVQDALPSSQEGFPGNSPSQDTPAPLGPAEMLLEAARGSPDTEGHPTSFTRQDLSALSFFQFQLHREESFLRSIPVEKLLAPDENGNRLLHKAVVQGRRALTFALAQRFASLNKIDEKDAEKRTALHLAAEKNQHLMVSDLISLGASVNKQDSSGKTPLHLCAENGYLRVLQVLKNCKDNGVCVEVDLPDRYGLTPLHRAALAHTVLVTQSQGDSGQGRLLRLRRSQILEGILCLLQMGAKPELQVPNSCPTSTTCLKLEENAELMCLLQTHKPQGQDVLQESYSLLDAPRGSLGAPAANNLPELCSVASSDLFDVLLKGKC